MPETATLRDYAALAIDYAEAVLSSEVVACKWTRLACERFLRDLERSESDPNWPYYFDPECAELVCDFIEQLPHIEGNWCTCPSPEEHERSERCGLITLESWQIFIFANVFGWRWRANPAIRRFTTVYKEVARKNGKSAEAGGVSLYCLCAEGESGPQVKCAATTGSQARIVFDVAKKMVDRTPDLRDAFEIEAFANSIVCHQNGGDLKPINAKASTQDGLNPHLAVIDELHAHQKRELFDVLKSARGARKNPLSWYVTTAGYNVEGVCYEQRALVTKILEGVIEADHYFGVIYTIDEDDDPFDESCWPKANPNFGVSVQPQEFRDYAKEARVSPDSFGEFLTKRLNVWTSARKGHINVTEFKRCDGDVVLEDLLERPSWGGLDLASTGDMNSFARVWPLEDDRVAVWLRYYLPEDAVQPRTERGNVPYQRWVKQGWITIAGVQVTNYAYIEKDLRAAFDTGMRELAYDPWNALDLANRLMADGYPLVEFRQSIPNYTGPMKEADRLYKSGKLRHGGNPVFIWNASNVVARSDVNENIAPDKQHSHEKIDGYCAFLMALARAIQGGGVSVYETRGVLVLG